MIGSFVLARLQQSSLYGRITVWARREVPVSRAQVDIVDFEKLADRSIDAVDVYCCLGTTLKQAGSQEAFRRVDFGYPVALARAAARGGARRLLVVSSLGADPRSGVFYSRVKGEMEEAVRAAFPGTTLFFRPSLLSGPRTRARTGERIGLVVGALLGPLLGKYRPIHGDLVAAAMLRAAVEDLPSQTLESGRIRALAGSRSS